MNYVKSGKKYFFDVTKQISKVLINEIFDMSLKFSIRYDNLNIESYRTEISIIAQA